MGGGLLQLVAQGAQDINLTGQPQISFFKANYKRHTNFATQWVPQSMNGDPKQGIESTKIQISRNGDLVQEMYLIAKIKDTVTSSASTVYMAERLVSSINLSIGGQQIDKHYQRWWRLFSELNHTNAKKDNYSKLVNLGPADFHRLRDDHGQSTHQKAASRPPSHFLFQPQPRTCSSFDVSPILHG